ncbi:MAG: hypothetical protein LBQ12_01000 [Deltaproteobacteria bacterium]|jgi:hypothetical protein|nr:hypothetical protein [Deltaproteobacteria bacterium]
MHAAYLVILSFLAIGALCVVFEVVMRKVFAFRFRKMEAARKLTLPNGPAPEPSNNP